MPVNMRTRPPLVLALALVASVACKSSDAPAPADAGPSEVAFPSSFLWGTATAGFQVEKGDSHTDWAHWVATAGKIKNGDSPDVGGDDALAHVDDDVALMKNEKHNAYRFSIEWGRLFPTQAAFDAKTPDPTALAAYDGLVAKLRAAGITPMMTLQHFSLPDWMSDVTQPLQPQGWERAGAEDQFQGFCQWAAGHFGQDIDWWITLNEPINMLLGGYLQGSFPPGILLNEDRAFTAGRAEIRAHAKCYDAIHAGDTADADGDGKAALVSIAAHMRTYHPIDPTSDGDKKAAEHARYVAQDWFLNAIVRGDYDDDLDEALTGPNDKTGDPALKGRADYLGVNYYSDTLIGSSASQGVLLAPPLGFAIIQDHMPTDRPKTDFAWDIYPEGFGTVLDEAAGYGLPVVVTENGVADHADTIRPRFLAEHLFQLGLAVGRGVDVRGYFHWSLLDNFEWANGFCPKFGLHSVDATTGARTPRTSASLYTSIIGAGKLTRAEVDAQPPYGDPVYCP
jgi:beta-glucosidase/6-phospho-beta-glucosidase/beta-galactosidase